jgi:hypothetical protein
MGFSPPVRAFEPLLATSPSFPSSSTPALEASHVLALQPLMLAHLRFDLTPNDPMIALEKALKRSLARGLGGRGLVTLSDSETAFMSRVSGLSMEPPARRHKDMSPTEGKKASSRSRKSGDGSDSGSSSGSDSEDDTKQSREPVFKVTKCSHEPSLCIPHVLGLSRHLLVKQRWH